MAPAFAANNACNGEKHKVMLTLKAFSDSILHAIKPSSVIGNFIVICGAILENSSASLSMFL